MALKIQILEKVHSKLEPIVWTVIDFIDLGSRDAIDKVLQHLVKANECGSWSSYYPNRYSVTVDNYPKFNY